MVSFWPWKGDDSSPASFERSLSAIAKKIGTASASLESSRQQSRRLKALWTLYTSISYLLYSMIVGLVVGIKNSGNIELGGLVGGPIVIYGIRQMITSFYAFRISRQQAYLESLQKERDGIIKKLKDATKYDSTQQLLEKYGGTPARPNKTQSNKNSGEDDKRPMSKNGRTMTLPPPTANIPRGPLSAPHNSSEQRPVTPKGMLPPLTAAAATPPWQQVSPMQESAEFAPNAFSPSSHYVQPGSEQGSRWYDRFMDVLLGEDESHPKNRIVLICKKCRLINGQAPPGVKTLADVGKWRCSSCGSLNEEESEVQRVVQEMRNSKSDEAMAEAEEEDSVLIEQGSFADDDTPIQTSSETLAARARSARTSEE